MKIGNCLIQMYGYMLILNCMSTYTICIKNDNELCFLKNLV